MSCIFTLETPRENYVNSFSFLNYIPKTDDGNYASSFKEEFEYVVVWYDHKFISKGNADESLIYIKVILSNLTEPYYTRNEKELPSYLTVKIPINFLHKMPFGSIWRDGKSKERIASMPQNVEVTDNYFIKSPKKAFSDDQNTPLFDYENYFRKLTSYDKNQLINIQSNNRTIIIHPLLLFIAHYGYSMEFKRIIARYSLRNIRERLILEDERIENSMQDQGIDEFVILPNLSTQRDAVFLHQLKYDKSVWEKVARVNRNIQRSRDDDLWVTKIDFLHLPITIRFRGIRVGNDKVLCTSIIGISEPTLPNINIAIRPPRGVTDGEMSQDFLNVRQYVVPQRVEEIDYVGSEVNNLTTLQMLERLERIGNLVGLNRVYGGIAPLPINDNPQFIRDELANNFGVGEHHGRGENGLALCFFDVEDIPNTNRFDKIWEHARSYAKKNNGTAEWFSFKEGYQCSDKFSVMSLANLNDFCSYPTHVLVLRVCVEGNTYYLLEFGEAKHFNSIKMFQGIIYQANTGEDFTNINGNLTKILTEVVSLKGTLTVSYVDIYEGRMALFKHPNSLNSNWVRNGINNLSK